VSIDVKKTLGKVFFSLDEIAFMIYNETDFIKGNSICVYINGIFAYLFSLETKGAKKIMKKGLKVLSTLGAATLAVASIAACSKSDVVTTTEPTTDPKPTDVVEDKITVDTSAATVTFIKGQEFNSSGIVVKTSNGTTLTEGTGEGKFIVNASAVKMDTLGEYNVTIIATVNGKKITATYKVSVVNEIVKEIATIEDFLEMRHTKDEQGYNEYSYKLMADLDLSNTKIDESDVSFKGVFDGNNHTIKGLHLSTTSSKQGLLFNKLSGEAVIKNVKFANCEISSTVETVAVVAGEVNDDKSNVTIENVEFSLCTCKTSNNYAALIIGRNEGGKVQINLKNITVKNLSTVSGDTYGSGLIGDIISGSKLVVKDCDIDLTSYVSQNGSQLAGRNRGADLDVQNVIFRGEMKSGNNSTGYVTGGGKESPNITIKNVLVLGKASTTGDVLLGNSKAKNLVMENNYYVQLGSAKNTKSYTELAASAFTEEWANNTLGLSKDVWEKDTEKVIKLKGSSANVPSEGAKLDQIKLITSNADCQFFQNETFTTEGLGVSEVWTDGCVVVSKEFKATVKNSEGTVVDTTDLSKLPVGKYTVTVSVTKGDVTKEASYDITIVSYASLTAEVGDAKLAYVVGNKFDKNNLYVFANLTDDTRQLLSAQNYELTITGDENNATVGVDDAFETAGVYTVKVTFKTLETTFKINVLPATEAVNGYVKVVVDPAAADGTFTATTATETNASTGYYSFKTIEKAVNYVESLGLADSAHKVIYVKNGTYTEKVTVSIPNVTIVGESKDKTILTYSAAEGTETLDGKSAYGMKCATLIAAKTATGFNLSNMTVRNDFDYDNSKIANKQAFAFQNDADESVIRDVVFTGVQDTLYANDNRQYYYNCYIAGAVDYVFGSGKVVAYFNNCTFHTVLRKDGNGNPSNNGGYVFAPKNTVSDSGLKYGYVVVNSTFESDEKVLDGSVSVARPWGAQGGVAIINSTFSKAYSKAAYGNEDGLRPRYDAMSGQSPEGASFFEYGNTGDGSITQAVKGVKFLTEAEAADYKNIQKVFAKTNGNITFSEDWMPVGADSEDPAQLANTDFVSIYKLGKETSKQGEALTASTIYAYEVKYNSCSNEVTSYKNISSNVTEKYFNAEGQEVSADAVIATMGTYTAKLMYNDKVINEATLTIVSATSRTETIVYDEAAGTVDTWTVTLATAGSSKLPTEEGAANSTGTVSCDKLVQNGTDNITSKKFDACKKAKVTILGGTTGTSNAITFKVSALAADGTVVESKEVSGAAGKVLGKFEYEFATTTDFVQLKVELSAPSGKHACILSINTVLTIE